MNSTSGFQEGRPVVWTAATTDQIPDETKVHCRRQLAQEMVSWDEGFVDHAKEAALIAVFSLHSAIPLSGIGCHYPGIIPPKNVKRAFATVSAWTTVTAPRR